MGGKYNGPFKPQEVIISVIDKMNNFFFIILSSILDMKLF